MKNIIVCQKFKFTVLIITTLLFLICITDPGLAAGDKEPPAAPKNISVTNVTYTSISLSWSPSTDNINVKGYRIFREGKKVGSTTKTSYTNSRLVPGKKYTYTVKAYDAAGNMSDDSAAVCATTMSDTQAPSSPEALTILSSTYTSIVLAWTPSTDDIKLKGYEIYCNDKKIGTTSSIYYTCKGLIPGKTYSFYVRSYDTAGNYSVHSSSISAATLSDNLAPSTPTGLKTTAVSETEISLAWSPSTDNVKVKKYEIFCDGIRVSSTSRTSYSSKRLFPGKNYTYTVRAIDSVGNISDYSSPFKVSTKKDLQPPTAPDNLKVNSLSKTSISLAWSASTDNVKVKGYQIFCNGFKIADTTRTHYTVKIPADMLLNVYWVRAYDIVNNVSDNSSYITIASLK